MGSNGTYKNKTHLEKEEKNQKSIFALGSKKKRGKIGVYGSWNKRLGNTDSTKKPEFNPSYGYGEISDNVHKCTRIAHLGNT